MYTRKGHDLTWKAKKNPKIEAKKKSQVDSLKGTVHEFFKTSR